MKRVKVILDKTADVIKALRVLAESRVMVGVPSSAAGRDLQTGEPINNAQIGYIQEHGAPEANIPARPHLKPGVEQEKAAWTAKLRDAATAAFEGKPARADRNLHAAGLIGQRAVRNKIQTGPFVPLSPVTLAKRKSRKIAPRQGEKPLLDTGQYRNSITYVVRRGVKK